MKKRYSEEQIIGFLKEAEADAPFADQRPRLKVPQSFFSHSRSAPSRPLGRGILIIETKLVEMWWTDCVLRRSAPVKSN